MAGSTLGTLFKITTWGESHGKGVGVVIDGCPAGLSLCEADIQKFLDRRKLQKLKSPPGHGAVPNIHHGDHNFPAKAFGLAGIFKE